MVQILPPKTDVGSAIGAGLGQGLGQGIAQGGNIAFQRNLVQNALQGLENLPPGTTPAQLASKLIQATAGIPGAERYVGQLYQSMLPSLQAGTKAQPEVENLLSQLQERPGIEGQPSQKIDFNTEVKQALGEKFFPNIQPHQPVKGAESLKPLKPLVPPQPIGPAEESKIRRLAMARGVNDPAVQDELIGKLRKYQDDVYAAQKERFGNLQQYQEARRERDENFFQQALPSLQSSHGTMTPAEDAIWKEMSRKYEDLPDPARFASTEQDYNALVSGPLVEFETSQRALPVLSGIRIGEVRNRLNTARSSVQDHLSRIEKSTDIPFELKGAIKNQLRDQYENSLISKDYGVAQAAYATRDLSKKFADAVPKYPGIIKLPGQPNPMRVPKVRDKYVYELANALADNLQPEDSLILARDRAITQNYEDEDFAQALNIALNSGRLTLSDVQGKERNKLSIPQQLDLDSLMQGYRSWGDVLKGKQ